MIVLYKAVTSIKITNRALPALRMKGWQYKCHNSDYLAHGYKATLSLQGYDNTVGCVKYIHKPSKKTGTLVQVNYKSYDLDILFMWER